LTARGARITLPAHVRLFPHLTTNCTIRQLRISLPLIGCLVDGRRYAMPDDLPPPSRDDLRPLYRPRVAQVSSPPAPRPDRKAWRARDLAELDQLIGKA
jgi:hypothetical protein